MALELEDLKFEEFDIIYSKILIARKLKTLRKIVTWP